MVENEKREISLEIQNASHAQKADSPQLIQLRETLKLNLCFIIALFLINVALGFVAYFFCGWWSVSVSTLLNLFGAWFGYKGIQKVQQIVSDDKITFCRLRGLI